MSEKINLSCSELKIPFHQLRNLISSGTIQLGIDNSVAIQISTDKTLQPRNKAVTGALHIWNWIAILIFIGSVYLSFKSAWWYFIFGILIASIIVKSNKKGNAENLLDEALSDQIFYNKILMANGWIYRIDKTNIQKVRDLVEQEKIS